LLALECGQPTCKEVASQPHRMTCGKPEQQRFGGLPARVPVASLGWQLQGLNFLSK
jgi:hypothetical protein